MSMIEFQDIQVCFGDFEALPAFSLSIEEGEFFTLLGPSGCGKSTALRTLAGFIQPSRGKVFVGGRDVTGLPSDKRGVGMVFQNYALFPSMSVADNIGFGLSVAKRPKAEVRERVAEIAQEVDLSEKQLGKSVADLSGGQQQRVAIARALVLRPKILLLDEPLSNLDAQLRSQLRGQLKDLQQQFGITTLYVTHDQDEAMSMSDRVAVLNHGHIEHAGTPREVYERSGTEFVCTFIGSVNRMTGGLAEAISRQGPDGLRGNAPMFVRTERVDIAPPGGTDDARVAVDGVVASNVYYGSTQSYLVDAAGQSVRVHVPTSRGQREFESGETVHLSIDPRDVMQYPHAEGGEAA